MLRSLVGSEMCIRDRDNYYTAEQNAEQGVWGGAGARDLGLEGSVDKDMFCLLYTSDAADDLLCVDLGGRRIIKKKKLIHVPYLTVLSQR